MDIPATAHRMISAPPGISFSSSPLQHSAAGHVMEGVIVIRDRKSLPPSTGPTSHVRDLGVGI